MTTDRRGEPKPALARGDLSIEGLPTDGLLWRVVWYCGIDRNHLAPSEPRVAILLISGARGVFKHRLAYVGLTNLGLIEIGTRWRDGRCEGSFETTIFDMIVRPASQTQIEPRVIRKLAKVRDPVVIPYLRRTSMIMMHTSEDDDTAILLPSLELFSRCFGASQYVKRTLATSTFDDSLAALTAVDRIPAAEIPAGHQIVTLNKRCFDADGVFVASLKFDAYARRSVRNFCGSLQAFNDRTPGAIVAPDTRTWWQEPVRMLVRGIVIEEYGRRCVLAYRVIGMGMASGPPLIIDRENTNRTKKSEREPETSRASVTRVSSPGSPAPERLVNTREPSSDIAAERIVEEPFQILDRTREISLAVTATPGDNEATVVPSEIAEAMSGGDYGHDDSRVAPARIHYEVFDEPTDDVSTKVWAAIGAIVDSDPLDEMTADVWCGRRFQTLKKPFALQLVNGTMNDSARWASIRADLTHRSRLYYLLRLAIGDHDVHFLDVERRQRNGSETEKLSGVAFVLSDGSQDLSRYLEPLLQEITAQRGTMSNVTVATPMIMTPYKHFRDDIAMKHALERAIKLVSGIDVRARHVPSSP